MLPKYFKIADSDFWNQIKESYEMKGGAYVLVCKHETTGEILPINRFLGTDTGGILYIGKAESFLDRVIQFKKSISPDYKGSSHICGRRYKRLCDDSPKISGLFPFKNLHIGLMQSDEPRKLENLLLENYEKQFGEVPPLNALGHDKKEVFDEP